MSLDAIAALLGHYAGDLVKSRLGCRSSSGVVLFGSRVGEGSAEEAEAPLLGKRPALAEDNRHVRVADLDRREELGDPARRDVLELE